MTAKEYDEMLEGHFFVSTDGATERALTHRKTPYTLNLLDAIRFLQMAKAHIKTHDDGIARIQIHGDQGYWTGLPLMYVVCAASRLAHQHSGTNFLSVNIAGSGGAELFLRGQYDIAPLIDKNQIYLKDNQIAQKIPDDYIRLPLDPNGGYERVHNAKQRFYSSHSVTLSAASAEELAGAVDQMVAGLEVEQEKIKGWPTATIGWILLEKGFNIYQALEFPSQSKDNTEPKKEFVATAGAKAKLDQRLLQSNTIALIGL